MVTVGCSSQNSGNVSHTDSLFPSQTEESSSPETISPDYSVTIITDTSVLKEKAETVLHSDLQKAVDEDEDFPIANTHGDLSVLTYINKIDDTYFLVDCYHNQVIYHHNLEDPIWQWNVLPGNLSMPHTIAGDGTVYLVDDTENHRVVVYEKYKGHFIITQTFDSIGNRPHYIQYNKADETFYVWSSMTGEMYLFRRSHPDVSGDVPIVSTDSGTATTSAPSADSATVTTSAPSADSATDEDIAAHFYHPVELTEIRKIDKLDQIYVRSFTILNDEIYFVSGNSSILRARLSDFCILEEYPVPAEMAGMIQLSKLGDMYYITISTDVTGNQDYATILRTKDLHGLTAGDYEDIYQEFVGGGTPYYISEIDGTYYLTEHRIPGHSLWSFRVEQDVLKDITAIY